MTLTSHGHHIPGTSLDDEDRTAKKLNCGGAGYCAVCSRDIMVSSERVKAPTMAQEYADANSVRNTPTHSVKRYQEQSPPVRARQFLGSDSEMFEVAQWVSEAYDWLRGNALKPEDLEVRNGCYIDPASGKFIVRFLLAGTVYTDVTVERGDWIIKDEDGDFRVVGPLDFALRYKEVIG